jgi:N-acetylglucosamine-6-phosphate deacetylase
MSNGISDVQQVYGNLDHVAIVTLAPELSGALDVVKQLTASGITVSLGMYASDTVSDNSSCQFSPVYS